VTTWRRKVLHFLKQIGYLKNDRRVKTVALTREGVKTKEELESRMYKPPEFILDLDRDVLESLHEVLASLVAAAKQ
jgi:hypothetical protein